MTVSKKAKSTPSKKVDESRKRTEPSLSDVARLANISRRVAGHVLNGGTGNTRVSEETANLVREAAAKLDYHPNYAARILRGKRSQTFGLLVASAGDPLRSFPCGASRRRNDKGRVPNTYIKYLGCARFPAV